VLFGAVLWPVLGLTWTFVVVGAAVVLSMVWLAVAAPETRGRNLDEDEPVGAGAGSAVPGAGPAGEA
jgi:putative MFS transporter